MMRHQNTRLYAFLSLGWYEVALRFLFTFVAKTSEILLAAGLVVSTANFLTDGSILAAHPGVSIAWAWAQALAIDSSLGVSLSYAFHCLKQEEWIKGALYGVLTLLLSVVAGAITTIDIVSHALHLSTGDAMLQMGINIAVLSRLRAIAVIGFILMSRLRDLPLTALLTKTEPQPSLAPANGQSQQIRVQAAIQSLCSQLSAEEMAQVLNTCIAAKKIVLAQVPPKGTPALHQPENGPEPGGIGAGQGGPSAVPPLPSGPGPISLTEPSRKAPMATKPPATVEERHLQNGSNARAQVFQAPEPIADVPSKEQMVGQEWARELQNGVVAYSEPEAVSSQERLEHAYQSLVAEGKKPSGRALAERAHVHRSTCVEWLRVKQQQMPENELLEEPEHDGLSMQGESPVVAAMDLPEKTQEQKAASVAAEPPEMVIMDLPEIEVDRHRAASSVSPDVFPNFSLPEDTADV